jgi:multiple sugar transport system substrate-binding protein
MIGGSDRQASPQRPPRAPKPRRRARGRPRLRVLLVAAAGVVLASSALAACGTSSASTGPVTLQFYNFPDPSGAVQSAADNCSKASHGRYTIVYNKLQNAADQQRLQMARRLAAHDPSMDILGLDVTWEPEFATAGWIRPWTGQAKAAAIAGTLKGPLQTAIWHGKLVAVPYNSNTQLLWYRSDLVKTPPKTWAQMFADAQALAKQGKPHLIEIQGAQYEGVVVWFNTLIASAGGSILNPTSTKAQLGAPAVKALSIMKTLASSSSADPSLGVQMEDQNRLAMEAGTAAFELNYPYVYPSMKADNPKLFKVFKWAPYPSVIPGTRAKVTIGGIDLAVSSYSPHPALAQQAVLCLRNAQNQLAAAVLGGLPPTLASVYSNPKMQGPYPFRQLILQQVNNGSVRPKTPLYQVVSVAISHLVSPPSSINPVSTEQNLRTQINNALTGKGLTP